MADWTHGEPGPTCGCGQPTYVIFTDAGKPALLCFAHTKESGALYCLPRERPATWPHLSTEEMQALIARGEQEHDADAGDLPGAGAAFLLPGAGEGAP
jgi:hypothetical protein